MDKEGIPDFPEFRALELRDKERLQPYFWQLQPEISDRCFTHLQHLRVKTPQEKRSNQAFKPFYGN
jgi:hypothetical protein